MRRTLLSIAGIAAGFGALAAEDSGQRVARLGCAEIAQAPAIRQGQDAPALGLKLSEWTPALLEILRKRIRECGTTTQIELARESQIQEAEERARADRVRAAEQKMAAAKAVADKAEAELAEARLILGRAAAEAGDRVAQRERRLKDDDSRRETFEASLRQQAEGDRRAALARAAEVEQRAEREAFAAREAATRQRTEIERQRAQAETRRVEAEKQAMEARATEARLKAMEEAARRQEAELLPLQLKAAEARRRVEAALEVLEKRTRGSGKAP